ncbi:hypothetical protein LQV05_001126 [Cryptococcus neoformans]|nr:hypothetical protein LQV05_001126 [Cryptococcus neoformans]
MAITTPLGLLEWVVMPQGIHNAPAAQQCCINEALQGLTRECCKAYVDDIIIWGKDAKDLHDCWSLVQAIMTYEPTLAPDILCAIAHGYQGDKLLRAWLADLSTAPGVTFHDHDTHQLLLVDNHLCIPDINNLREDLMWQAHEGTAGHLGVEKTGDTQEWILLGDNVQGCM